MTPLRLLRLCGVMLRYRAALMIWLFMLLGAAHHGALQDLGWRHAAALVALAASYIAATSINDIADKDLDRINHPFDRARPLVTGDASERDLQIVYGCAALVALLAATTVGVAAVGIIGFGLLLGYIYSMPPLAVSYRTYLSPLLLAIAYVVIPYGLGIAASASIPNGSDLPFVTGLVALFVARIVLKDFRDRVGDAAYGRRTLLQRFGRTGVCRVSLAGLVMANLLLLGALLPRLGPAIAFEAMFLAIAWMLHRLETASDERAEQIAIGIGARLGNGLLLIVLGLLVLEGGGASYGEVLLFVWSLTGIYAVNFLSLIAHPEDVLIGYKG